MQNLTKTMIALLTMAVLSAPLAAADPLDDLHIEKDVAAHYKVDYSHVLDAADDAKELVGEAKTVVEEKANSKAQASATATTGLGSGILAGVTENVKAFMDWAKGLAVKPKADAGGYVSGTHAQDLIADAKSMDGSIEGDVLGHIEATSMVEQEVTPPEPKLGFLGEMRAAFDAFLNWG